jgi:hypothetical protein
MEAEVARTPKFDQVWSAEALDDSGLIDAFLLHGVVFLQYPEDDHMIKYAHKTQELASSFFDEDQDGKNVFSTGQAVGDAGYQLRPVLKEQYQLRYGLGAKEAFNKKIKPGLTMLRCRSLLGIHNPNVFTSKKFVKIFGKFEKCELIKLESAGHFRCFRLLQSALSAQILPNLLGTYIWRKLQEPRGASGPPTRRTR